MRAAEIQLKPECQPSAALVRLGDVAEIYAADTAERDALGAIELCPSPAAGGKRFLRVGEIQELLLARGVNLRLHRLSGAAQVMINAEHLDPAGGLPRLKAVTATMERQAVEALRSAIVESITGRAKEKQSYEVRIVLDDSQIQAIDRCGYRIAISGGKSPFLGTQEFTVALTGLSPAKKFHLKVDVNLPPTVVYVTHSVPRGAILQPGDVTTERQRGSSLDTSDDVEYCSRLEDAVGRETTRALGAGQPIQREFIRQPLYIRRGDAVTVFARSSGLRVRTTARSRDDGSLGDLITVESMLNRQTFFARVVGPQEVEIYARAPDTGSASRTTESTTVQPRR